jgi:hypothetical protein
MKRLVSTSRGPVELELAQNRILGTEIALTTFGPDGWQDATKLWTDRVGHDSREQTLAQFLEAYAQIPKPEAERLADDVLGPWLEERKARGGDEGDRFVDRWTLKALASAAVVVALALAGLVGLILLLVGRP